jgi:hypothetical protein
MALGDIGDRFGHLLADAETIGGKVKDIVAKAAQEIDGLFGTDSHPAHLSIIQLLERAAQVAVSSPALAQPPAATDPTPAGQQEPANAAAAQTPQPAGSSSSQATDTQPAGETSGGQNTESEGTSQP